LGICSQAFLIMKASSYFTDGEIELAMGILADLLSNQDFLNEISISHDATDKYYKLIDKIDVYFNDGANK